MAIQYLWTADEHDARGIEKVIERTVKTDGAHCSLTDVVTGIKAVNDTVDGIDNDEQYLIGKELEKQFGEELEFCRLIFHINHHLRKTGLPSTNPMITFGIL